MYRIRPGSSDTNRPASSETREPPFDIGTRVRDVKGGADGMIYFVTDEEAGHRFRVEPAQ
jgi:glucose/arabinose dehydrogenase